MLQSLQSLLSQAHAEPLSAPVPSLQGMLSQRVTLEGAVSMPHAQCGAAAAGHAGEALAAWEAEYGHLVEAHAALCAPKLGPPQDGPNWIEIRKRQEKVRYTVSRRRPLTGYSENMTMSFNVHI